MKTYPLPAILCCAAALLAESASGISWKAPKDWVALGSRPMRAASYMIPKSPGDSRDAECGVFYFGAGQGGSIDANVQRWTGQFTGGPKPKIATKTVGGLRVTTVEAAGNYTGMGGPMMQGKSAEPGYRLLGAIVAAPEGNVFFKFTGPAKTVTANAAKFNAMIDSVKKQ